MLNLSPILCASQARRLITRPRKTRNQNSACIYQPLRPQHDITGTKGKVLGISNTFTNVTNIRHLRCKIKLLIFSISSNSDISSLQYVTFRYKCFTRIKALIYGREKYTQRGNLNKFSHNCKWQSQHSLRNLHF